MDRSISYALKCVGCPSMTLKPEQKACVNSIYEGKDVFLWLPTGFGKSICYEVLPFVFDIELGRVGSLVFVVSPLVSLMIDQVRSLRSRGVNAAVMSSRPPWQVLAIHRSHWPDFGISLSPQLLSPKSLLSSCTSHKYVEAGHHFQLFLHLADFQFWRATVVSLP